MTMQIMPTINRTGTSTHMSMTMTDTTMIMGPVTDIAMASGSGISMFMPPQASAGHSPSGSP
ncbi:hypothetical protein AA3271_0065 [Gluconobacter japonicus NBRC 3271]|nr:hypothetical protein AA3271_0065 [Gluconobacter japonicus NBRC 3271]